MRKLLLFTVGFAGATALCAYLLEGILPVYLALLCAMGCVGLCFVKHNHAKAGALALIGLCAGFLYCWGYDVLYLTPAKEADGKHIRLQVEATDYSFATDYAMSVDGKITLNGKTYPVQVYYPNGLQVQPGDVLEGSFRMEYTSRENTDSMYRLSQGTFLLAYTDTLPEHTPADSLSLKHFAAVMRHSVSQRLDSIFPEDTAAFAKALLIGDDRTLEFSHDISLQKSGLRHIIAVSGLHVSILFSLIFACSGRKPMLTVLMGLPVLFLFAAVAGFSPSVVRACLMQMLMLLSMALRKEYDPPTALSFAILVMLLANPLAVTSVGLQLSAGSVIGILVFSKPVARYFHHEKRLGPAAGNGIIPKLKRWFIHSVSASVGTMLVTTPLCAVYFETVSVIGILSNLLTLWLVSFLFYGVMAAFLLSFVWFALGIGVAWVVSVPIRVLLGFAGVLAKVPFGAVYTQSPYISLWLICTYALIVCFFVLERKKPMVLLSGILLLFTLAVSATVAEPYTDSVRLTALDVGQGQCLLLQSKNSAYLVDCGGENPKRTAQTAIRAMGAQGIGQLDGVILTHYDIDHANAAAYLLSAVPVKQLYLPDITPESAVRQVLENSQTPITWIQENRSLPCGTGEIFLYPSENAQTDNESSMCILFRNEKCGILITGDRNSAGENRLIQQQGISDVDVLVVGHHGAATSTGPAFLQTVKPEIAVISVGKDNFHRHPDAQTLNRLYQSGCTVRRTDLEGTIIIRG